MAKKWILVIVVVIIMLLMMVTPVSAVVKPPMTVKDALLKGIWGAIMDLQNQITTLTKKVDTIQASPIPEYRAGSYTTPLTGESGEEGILLNGHHTLQTVKFSRSMPNINYRVTVTNVDTSSISDYPYSGTYLLTIDSKTVTGFTFSYRYTGGAFPIKNGHKFDYIAIADN